MFEYFSWFHFYAFRHMINANIFLRNRAPAHSEWYFSCEMCYYTEFATANVFKFVYDEHSRVCSAKYKYEVYMLTWYGVVGVWEQIYIYNIFVQVTNLNVSSTTSALLCTMFFAVVVSSKRMWARANNEFNLYTEICVCPRLRDCAARFAILHNNTRIMCVGADRYKGCVEIIFFLNCN